MESLKNFEWYRNTTGYRLAWMPQRGKDAFWITEPSDDWSSKPILDRSAKLHVSTTEYHGEKRVAPRGMYIGHTVQILNRGKPDEVPHFEVVRPFQSNELLSLNLLVNGGTPRGWLNFVGKFGMIGHHSPLDRWHLSGKGASKDRRFFICDVEHEGDLNRLRNVLSKIYYYHSAIQKRDEKFLSKSITWDNDDVVRKEGGVIWGKTRLRMAIAMRGEFNSHYFERMKRPDLFAPAAFIIRDDINRYMEKALSLEVDFDSETLEFTSSLQYGSFGAALVAEAVEFMAGHFEARQCTVCGSWFRVGAGQMRQDRRFCSAACKMRDYRIRKQQSKG
jgi:hypothetical protein